MRTKSKTGAKSFLKNDKKENKIEKEVVIIQEPENLCITDLLKTIGETSTTLTNSIFYLKKKLRINVRVAKKDKPTITILNVRKKIRIISTNQFEGLVTISIQDPQIETYEIVADISDLVVCVEKRII